MAVPEQTPYIEYSANGISKKFSVPFQCLSKNTLIVSIDGVETLPQLWDFNNGEIIFITAPLNNSIVSIKRSTHLKREVSYNSYTNSMLPTVFNGDFDRIWHVLQEYQFGLDNKVSTLRKISTSGNLQGGGSLEEDLTLFLKDQAVTANIAYGSSIKIPVITLNQDGTIKSLQEVDVIGGEGGEFRIAWGDIHNKPDTLAGYGITNAYTKSEANNAFIEDSEKGAKNGVATLGDNLKVPVEQLPTATEVVTGVAKIATTAIAQAGVNDTDFLTAKKLRDALNAEGIAPVYTSRAIAQGNSSAASPVLTRKLNISTASKINNQVLSFTFTTAMPDNNYTVLGFGSDQAIGVEGFSGGLIGFDQTTTGFKVKYSFANQASSQSINSFRLVVL